jgi:hypothetical protein
MGTAPPSDEQIAKLKAFLIENAPITQPVPVELASEVALQVITKSVRPEPDDSVFAAPPDDSIGDDAAPPAQDAVAEPATTAATDQQQPQQHRTTTTSDEPDQPTASRQYPVAENETAERQDEQHLEQQPQEQQYVPVDEVETAERQTDAQDEEQHYLRLDEVESAESHEDEHDGEDEDEQEEPHQAGSDPENALSWITADQRNLLESEIDPIRGDHAEWLPDELDRRRPGWRTEDAQELSGWFDGILVDLAMVSEEVVELENFAGGETDRIMTDFVESTLKPVLEQLSEEERAALTDEDIAELMDELFREDFEAITSEAEQG